MKLSEPTHLSKFEKVVTGGAEWRLAATDWAVVQLSEGIAYAFDRKGNRELPLGGVIVCPPKSEITLTASVLGKAVFRGMMIRVSSLTGFLTALERKCLESEVASQCAPFLALPAEHPLARRTAELFAHEQAPTLSNRLAMVQMFSELVGPQLHAALNKEREQDKTQQDAKKRLRQYISQTPESELAGLSLEELAKELHCCERHASRLFREEWGTGFLSYVTEIRLKTACHLLTQGNLKIIDVALESGHGSIAHFNYVFKKRFHMTPTEWRERQTTPARRAPRPRPVQLAAAALAVALCFLGILKSFGAEPATGTGTNKPAATPAKTGAMRASSLHFKVDRYEVRGNTVLSSNVIYRTLEPFTGDAVDIGTITNAMAALQLEYYRRGFVTVKVTAPPQQVTNKVIFFEATEGRLASVKVLHNRYYSSNNVMSSLPYVQTLLGGDRILNGKIFQTELDRANANPDRQISPEVRAGLEPGTTALVLDVKDRLPLHGRLEWDNYSPPGTPDLRVNANVSYADLWQLDHTLGLQYGFSPQRLKPSIGDDTHLQLNPMDAPNVSYYSAFYRAPLGPPEGLENQIARDPNHFGYNETTRQFVLPPNTARPEFSAFVSRSTTGPTLAGPQIPVVNDTNLIINKQLITQQYTVQTTAGGRLSFPLPEWKGIQSSWSIGLDYKEDKVVSLPTNYFYYTTIVTHGTTVSAPPTITQSSIGIAGVGTYPSLNYTPMELGWTGWREDQWAPWGGPEDLPSRFDGGISLIAGMGGIFFEDKEFPILIANTKQATTEFVAVRPQLSRTQMLPDNFTLYENMQGQWANEPLVNLEQFALGGNASVRGYREGELYTDTGWLEQTELRTPIYWRGENRRVGTQFTVFMDFGEGWSLDPALQSQHDELWGGGAGVNFNLGPHVESHVAIGWPLLNSPDTRSGHERITFSLSAQL